MNNNEYLNEENYQKTKKKITNASLIILIAGLVIGIGLIIVGAVSQISAKKTNEERHNEAYKLSQEKVAAANARLTEIEIQKKDLNDKIQTKQYECNSLDMSSSSWYADQNKCQSEVRALTADLSKLEMEKFQLENDNYTVYYDKVSPMKYIIFYILGGGVIIVSCIIAGSIYLIAKKREISAFTIQQTMPIAKETISKMAPTVGNAAGTVGKELAKGITSGIKEGLNSNQNTNNYQNMNNNEK